MCGPEDSVIGVKKEAVIERFHTALPARFDMAKSDPIVNGVLIECEEGSLGAKSIQRLYIR